MMNLRQFTRLSAGLLPVAGILAVLGCHGKVARKPIGPAARDTQRRFHQIPAHAVPPCASCHVEAGVSTARVGLPQCGSCHGTGNPPNDRLSPAPQG